MLPEASLDEVSPLRGFEGTSSEWAYKNEFALLIKVCRHSSSSRKANALWEPYFRCALPPRTPTVCHGHPVQSFSNPPLSSKLGREKGGDSRAPTSLRSATSNTHSLPRASCAKIFPPPCLSKLRHVVLKIFAERGGFEPPKPFWSLHAFQACLFNHSSISPSRQRPKNICLRTLFYAVFMHTK